MKKQTWINVKLTLIVVLFSFCSKDWLDKKTIKTQAVPSALKDYQALLNNSVVINTMAPALIEIASGDHYISESVWASSTFFNAKNAYTWSQLAEYNKFSPWGYAYTRLYYPNLVLDGLSEVKVVSDNERQQLNHIRAQALFLKAETYYWLAQHYSQPYDPLTARVDQGIVVQENSDFLTSVKRVSVYETYEQILASLKESVLYLPPAPRVATQASLPAAYALLARTYLMMREYDSAFVYADKCLKINKTLLDYSKLSLSGNFVGQFNAEVLFHDQFYTLELSEFITSGCFINSDLFKSYEDNDLRKVIFFNATSTGIRFKGTYNNSATDLFCGIATDEVYLMRAECYARKGDVSSAMADLNDLLRTRWRKIDGVSTYKDQVAGSAEEALVRILVERRKELLLRGIRWSDLRRLNKEDKFRTTLERTIGGKTYYLEPNSYKYTFPIPVDMLQYSKFPQTTGWE